MSIRRAIHAYKKTVNATTPVIDTKIELLQEMSRLLQELSEMPEPDKELLKKLQQALFDLMSAVDQQMEEGRRLVLLYVYLNQQLITVQLYGRSELLIDVKNHIDQLAEAWKEARTSQRLNRFTADLL